MTQPVSKSTAAFIAGVSETSHGTMPGKYGQLSFVEFEFFLVLEGWRFNGGPMNLLSTPTNFLRETQGDSNFIIYWL